MPEHSQYQDDELFNPSTAHEHSDVPLKPLWAAIVIFLIFAAVSHALLFFLFKGFARIERMRSEAPQTAIARPANASVPQNQPLLQPFPQVQPKSNEPMPPYQSTPVVDLQQMRAAEDAVLHHYGWVDQQKGIVHIPIDEAKDRAVQMFQNQAAPAAPVAAPAVPAPDTVSVPDSGNAPAATTTGGTNQ